MSQEFVLIEKEQFVQLREILDELSSVLEEITTADVGTLNLPEGTGQTSLFSKNNAGQQQEKYEISRNSEYSYADVVDREIPEEEFSLDEAWKKIRGKITTEAKRPRDSFRQSLDNDPRFDRISNGRPGTWYTRTDVEVPDKASERRNVGVEGFEPSIIDHTDEPELPKGYRLRNSSLGWYVPLDPNGSPLAEKNKRREEAIEICRNHAQKKGRFITS